MRVRTKGWAGARVSLQPKPTCSSRERRVFALDHQCPPTPIHHPFPPAPQENQGFHPPTTPSMVHPTPRSSIERGMFIFTHRPPSTTNPTPSLFKRARPHLHLHRGFSRRLKKTMYVISEFPVPTPPPPLATDAKGPPPPPPSTPSPTTATTPTLPAYSDNRLNFS